MLKKIVVFILCLFFIGCGNTFDTRNDKMVIHEKSHLESNYCCFYFENRYFNWSDRIIAPCDFADIGDRIVYENGIIKIEKLKKEK